MSFSRWIAPLALIASLTSPAHAAEPDKLTSLSFLLGDWEAVAAKAGDPTGGCRFASDLGGRVIVRTNHAEYAAAGGRPATHHEDLMVIYAEGDKVAANYYDNEGHIIRYAVDTPDASTAVFTTDAAVPGPRFRLTYKKSGDGAVAGTFEIWKSDAFAPYLTWTLKPAAKK
ncbi:MAG TPA: hypothetical protein VMR65_06265 [Candidatus Sulfotelmatobacter sp.]|jgi:hypothetical protein|nr:hypothetical protein [Candidatus Sulfotelmatobacter sp.]